MAMIKKLGMILLLCSICLSTEALAQKNDADVLYRQALLETNQYKNYPKAITLARKGLELAPQYIDIRVLLGRLYILSNDQPEGIRQLKMALTVQPGNTDALNLLINTYYVQKNYDDALLYIARYLQHYPADKGMLLKEIGVLYDHKQYGAGAAALDAALKKFPADEKFLAAHTDLRLVAAAELQKRQEWQQAIQEYQSVLSRSPENKEALNALFNLNVRMGNTDRALQYADAIDRLQADGAILMKKADLLRSMARYDEALAVAERLRAKEPDSERTRSLYTDILAGKAKYQLQAADSAAALTSYRKIISAYPQDSLIRKLVIGLEISLEQYPAALQDIEEGLQHHPAQSDLLIKKTQVYELTGLVREAYQTASILHEQQPDNKTIEELYRRLLVSSRANRIGIHYSHTLFDPSNWQPWNVYGLSYLRSEKNISFGARVNYASRGNGSEGYQFELEAYPSHGRSYSYINVAYSNAPVFPGYRATYSYYTPLNQQGDWEGELGLRYIHSLESFLGYTLALGKYFDRTWLNIRINATPSGKKLRTSYSLAARQYLGDGSDDYFNLSAGYGFSPEIRDISFDIRQRISLESLRFGLGYQRTLWQRNILGLFGNWNRQEYSPGRTRNELEFSVSFQHKF